MNPTNQIIFVKLTLHHGAEFWLRIDQIVSIFVIGEKGTNGAGYGAGCTSIGNEAGDAYIVDQTPQEIFEEMRLMTALGS